MHLRSGRVMSNPEHQSTSESRPSLEQTIGDLAKSVRDLLDRVERIETSQRETTNHEGDNMLGQNNNGHFNRAPHFEHDHYNHYGPRDYDDRMSKERIEAPTFDGCLDPWVFTDWLRQMEKFFDYYHWAENRKVRYARMKLIGRADLFWEDLEETLRRRREPPIIDWMEMKDALSRNYLPPTYRSSLLEEWDRLRQGTAPVTEYIEKFKEFQRRIRIVEEEVVTLNRFKKGLNANLLGEIITRGVTTLREAYDLARNSRCPSRTLVIQEDDEKVENVEELVYDPNAEEVQGVEAK
ncbi:hypothetical protein CMV_018465 [Castanea mollissima]|uniref:Retrotransposon gag domain-containing protein n=1 Tax=Castanea mollissima TaxID=60419 RepID=A0A8J4QMZ6_9ROSI|nr:hypothetical protein CMV_018465 [Castanea mollissima]